ncbi:MAG: ABC transporter permease [Chloroflexi bacterium]|nr:ABC transporter permease [Chloroflexota bacterium]MDA1147854.1 ABC transporter permease [Chloroflexota bacterium]
MHAFIIRRLLASVFVLFVVTLVTFVSINVLPGDIASRILGPEPSPTQVEALRERLQLDEPLIERYWDWISGAVRGDFGTSIRTQQPVGSLILDRLEVTAELGTLSLLLGVLIAIPTGVIAGSRPGTVLDYGLTMVAVAGVSIPNFWLAIVMIIVFSVNLGWFPALGFTPISDGLFPNLRSLTLPAIAIGLSSAGSLARQVRGAMVEVMRQDYVRTARAKGLQERVVIVRHGLRNAMIPVVTILGLQMTVILGGSIIIETVFQLPGVGKLLIDSILIQEIVVVQGVTVLLAAAILMLNLLVDISYAYLDPRIRYS